MEPGSCGARCSREFGNERFLSGREGPPGPADGLLQRRGGDGAAGGCRGRGLVLRKQRLRIHPADAVAPPPPRNSVCWMVVGGLVGWVGWVGVREPAEDGSSLLRPTLAFGVLHLSTVAVSFSFAQ